MALSAAQAIISLSRENGPRKKWSTRRCRPRFQMGLNRRQCPSRPGRLRIWPGDVPGARPHDPGLIAQVVAERAKAVPDLDAASTAATQTSVRETDRLVFPTGINTLFPFLPFLHSLASRRPSRSSFVAYTFGR